MKEHARTAVCWCWATFAVAPVVWVRGIIHDPGTGDASGARLTALVFGVAAAWMGVDGVRRGHLTGGELATAISALAISGSVALWMRGRGGRNTPPNAADEEDEIP